MSAIAGMIYFDDRPVDSVQLDRMITRLRHRGPDDSGIWTDGAIGFGHCMQHTTPEAQQATLPRYDPDSACVITADARLDNRDELITTLRLPRDPEYVHTDSDLILAAYHKWKRQCTDYLLGDFAFAIWDGRRQELFCARDHFGVRPFYYYFSRNCFVFASEIKALICLTDVPRRLNEVCVADYLVPILEDKAITFYRGIRRLPPAHAMMVDASGLDCTRYWQLDPRLRVRYTTTEQYEAAFREHLFDAVGCRLRTTDPPGILLSGGLDSASVVSVMRHLSRTATTPLYSFTAVFDSLPECNEREFVDTLVRSKNLQNTVIDGDTLSPLADFECILSYQDEPFAGPNMFLYWALCQAAQRRGVTVLLGGYGGDAVLWQEPAYLAELLRRGQLSLLVDQIRGFARTLSLSEMSVVWSYVLRPLVPDPIRRLWRGLRNRPQQPTPWREQNILDADFAQRIGLEERYTEMAHRGAWWAPGETTKQTLWRRLNAGNISYTLEMCDRAAAAFGIELRHPFWDRRLVEFCFGLPPEQKLNHGLSRTIMRRALTPLLPQEIRRRKKSNISAVFTRALYTFESEKIERIMETQMELLRPYLDVQAVRESYQRFCADRNPDDAVILWQVVTLALWLRQLDFIESM